MAKYLILTIIMSASLGLALSQEEMTSGDLAIKLYELANQDSVITETESDLIKEILHGYEEGEEKTAYTIEYKRPRKRLRKDLNPMTYISQGLELGYKNSLFRLQGKIIGDMNEAAREIIDKK